EAARRALVRSFDAWARDPVTPGALDKGRWAQAEAYQCGLLRCLFGNPFREVAFEPRWGTADVAQLARAVYAGGHCERLPILADALMDAGCADEAILGHCRGAGPHARGCWVLDRLLGRE